MNSATYEAIFGHKRIRKTWKHTLSPEKNAARIAQMRFSKQVRQLLEGYEVTFYFNPGGSAVWGETYLKVKDPAGRPIVEACLSVEFSYMRQWNGSHSGRNHQISYTRPLDPPAFAMAVKELERREFRRF